MNNVELFIEEYKKLEEAVRRVYDVDKQTSIVSVLKLQKRFEKYKNDIQSCADLRNFYQHDSKIKNRYVSDVSDEAIEFIRSLTLIVNDRKKCKDRCIPFKNVYWRTLNDSVKDTMRVMNTKMYTHVPILDGGKVIGVFDENSLFSFISSDTDGIFEFDDSLRFSDLISFINLNDREMEEFKFLKITSWLDDAVSEFNKSFENGKRLGLLMLTASGKPNEELQGILTPWDVIGD